MKNTALIRLAEDILRGETRDFLLIYKITDGPLEVSTTDKTWATGAAALAAELVERVEVGPEEQNA